jgi:hypothetical protein
MLRDDRSAAPDLTHSRPPADKNATLDLVQLQRLARAGLFGAFVAPSRLVVRGPVMCALRRMTGQPCPSCGLTRSWSAVAPGRLSDGFRMHPLGPAAFAGALLLALAPRRWLERAPAPPSAALTAFASVWVVVWLVRLLRGSARRSGVID